MFVDSWSDFWQQQLKKKQKNIEIDKRNDNSAMQKEFVVSSFLLDDLRVSSDFPPFLCHSSKHNECIALLGKVESSHSDIL